METSFQAWKFAKGLYLIPLFMVFNPVIIEGGPIPIVLWNGFIAILALAAFAAALEGFLFTYMKVWMRVGLSVAVVGVFYPELAIEIAAAVTILLLLALNFVNHRREGQAVPDSTDARELQ